MRSASPGGPTTGPSGPGAVPVNPSAPPGSEPAQMTLGICGPHGSGLSASAGLSQRLANRLRARLPTAGSMEYRQTWKQKATPSGRSYWAHTASARRTSDNGSGGSLNGWPTPNVPSGGRSIQHAELRGQTAVDPRTGKKVQVGLEAVAKMAGWPTPQASVGGPEPTGATGRKLSTVAGWADAAPHGRVEERADARRGRERSAPERRQQRPWDDSRLIPCADARARRIPQSRIFPLADGVPGRTGSTTGGSSRRSVTCRRRSVNSSTI